jgi:hypothetical protein
LIEKINSAKPNYFDDETDEEETKEGKVLHNQNNHNDEILSAEDDSAILNTSNDIHLEMSESVIMNQSTISSMSINNDHKTFSSFKFIVYVHFIF